MYNGGKKVVVIDKQIINIKLLNIDNLYMLLQIKNWVRCKLVKQLINIGGNCIIVNFER